MADKKPTKKATVVNSSDDLEAQLATKQQDLYDAKRSHKSGELVNPRVLTTTRRDIARIKTAIRANTLKEKK